LLPLRTIERYCFIPWLSVYGINISVIDAPRRDTTTIIPPISGCVKLKYGSFINLSNGVNGSLIW